MSRRDDAIAKITAMVKDRFGGDPRRAFDYYDLEHRGSLSGSNLWSALYDAGIGNRFTRGIYVAEIIKAIDADEDARLSWEEFQAIATTA